MAGEDQNQGAPTPPIHSDTSANAELGGTGPVSNSSSATPSQVFQQENQVVFRDIIQKDPFVITVSIPGIQAATATNYGVIFTALYEMEIVEVSEVHQTKGTDGGAVSLQLEKLTGTQALDAGATILTTAIDLKGTINTVVYPALTMTKINRVLLRGHRLALKDAGTLTAVAGVQLTIRMIYRGQGVYRNS